MKVSVGPRALALLATSASALALALAAAPCRADILRYCSQTTEAMSVAQQDRLLRFSAVVKQQLEASGQELAIVARAGLDLQRFGLRYSHAGISLKASPNTPWSVRQLYFACDENRPRLFDQGLAGFLLGTLTPDLSVISLLLLPPEAAAPVQALAADDGRALQLLAPRYSANAYAFGLSYQNCNQWLLELLAAGWAGLQPSAEAQAGVYQAGLRAQAQAWLQAQGYQPTAVELGWRPLMWAGALIPWVHSDDHPAEDLAQLRYRVSMPDSIEQFVRQRWPEARRVELCLRGQQVVLRRGWLPLSADCAAAEDDQVIDLGA
ncbi:DUF2145 domain-containing protein [Paucibacter sp. DJ2R-2]|uniref:DUF2145 domain-containing protein n=1 Tax=Paucibacter sp. DJ2R-2 TaxID=2893558 RepID=UPI0021E3AF57|nr:DUF2145 domain-containing protein [Paucibacter sp. DJ2R-2]MCV2436736.1 DUF2145 domain-containing protein [Paucibacter sp. DJ2R-2]